MDFTTTWMNGLFDQLENEGFVNEEKSSAEKGDIYFFHSPMTGQYITTSINKFFSKFPNLKIAVDFIGGVHENSQIAVSIAVYDKEHFSIHSIAILTDNN